MALVVFGSYMMRYPMGGMMSHVLQYLVGLKRLGHEVVFVEKAGYSQACFDPVQRIMTDDCEYGIKTVTALFRRFHLDDGWCFVDAAGRYHGLQRADVESKFRLADVFIDMGTHGAWLEEAKPTPLRVLLDGEPGYNQIRMLRGDLDPDQRYHRYYTTGQNVGTPASDAPTARREWGHLFHPVATDMFDVGPRPNGAPMTTVMNWKAHESIEYRGTIYGQKDREFDGFVGLPSRVGVPLEVAISGPEVPAVALRAAGWQLRDGDATSASYEGFCDYLTSSLGEFSVAKNVFVAFNTGWFSDRSAAYLASGRPVVVQDTGFSDHLPIGQGLFAVKTVDEAADAIAEIDRNWSKHSSWARSLARQHLDTTRVLGRLLYELGVRVT